MGSEDLREVVTCSVRQSGRLIDLVRSHVPTSTLRDVADDVRRRTRIADPRVSMVDVARADGFGVQIHSEQDGAWGDAFRLWIPMRFESADFALCAASAFARGLLTRARLPTGVGERWRLAGELLCPDWAPAPGPAVPPWLIVAMRSRPLSGIYSRPTSGTG